MIAFGLSMNERNLMKSVIFTCAVATFLLFDSVIALAAENDGLSKPYVTVNGTIQTNARAEILLREQIARGVQDSQNLRDGVRELLINQAVMEQEALKAGLDKEVLLQAQIDLARQNILAQAWQQKVASKLKIKDDDLKAEYDRQIERLGDKEYLIRHLLVTEAATAKLLIEIIKSGAKIADLAKEYSRDASNNEKGGLTNWTAEGVLLPPLAAAVKTLPKGKLVTQPIKTDAGWHVVQLEDTRPFKAPSMQDLKPQLIKLVERRLLDEQIKELRNKAKVK